MAMASCAIALGSNLGDSRHILCDALRTLNDSPDIQITAQSQLYKTAPVGPPQPDFWNCCALLQTTLSPELLLQQLLQVETHFGRVRRERWGPRLLDLDLLLVDDLVLKTPTLQIPHPRMWDRAFVLIPLAEIAAGWMDPVSGKTVAMRASELSSVGIYQESSLR
jgi:2-amino-4-hydroxy-6-hydroxymethyldihydropteridine diphosphokinase